MILNEKMRNNISFQDEITVLNEAQPGAKEAQISQHFHNFKLSIHTPIINIRFQLHQKCILLLVTNYLQTHNNVTQCNPFDTGIRN